MSWILEGRPLSRVLVTRLRYLGDIVMSTVVLQALHRGDPDLKIDYLCEAAFGDVLEGQPELDRLYRLGTGRRGSDARARGHQDGGDRAARGAFGTVRDIRRRRPDLAVDLFFNPRSAWLLRLTGIRFRIGGTDRSRRHLYTHAVLRSDPRCATPEFAALAQGGLGEHLCRLAPLQHGPTGQDFISWLTGEFTPGDLLPRLSERTRLPVAEDAMTRAGVDPQEPFLLLAPGATWPTKEWPAERWREFIPRCRERFGLPLAVVVPPGRSEEFRSLTDGLPPGAAALLDPVPLAAVLSLVSASAGVVTVDGGLMHAAVGLGKPVVALFGPTDPSIWFPYGGDPRFQVLATRPECHPCDLHRCDAFICLPDLQAPMVSEALAEVLDGRSSHA